MSRSQSWRSQAFGFAIESKRPIVGLPRVESRAGRPTRVELVDAATIDSTWPADEATRLLEEPSTPGAEPHTIDRHERAGYRLHAPGYGLAQIDRDGLRVVCALTDRDRWQGLRFLLGRVLPWTAVLRGLEVFHASAVAIAGQAVAFFGPSGAGKSSLAVRLVGHGARLLTDDALAVDRGAGGALRAHPGAAIVSLREQVRPLGPNGKAPVGSVLGHGEKLYVEAPRADRAQGPRLVYLLTSTHGPAEGGDHRRAPAFEEISAPDPRVLLGSTFVLAVQTPERLQNQLDVCAELARSASFFAVRMFPTLSADELAVTLDQHARERL